MPDKNQTMLTYNLENINCPLYKALYQFIRQDIQNGKLKAHQKMPSKRTFAKNLGISTISIENAYDQLICEGYLYTLPKRGYFVCQIENLDALKTNIHTTIKKNDFPHIQITPPSMKEDITFDFSSNITESTSFPFSIWAKIIRETVSKKEKDLLKVSPPGGVLELRIAIANHLESFRGMQVHPDQIIIGAGTEYLYGLLIKLLGNSNTYCIENPGYKKLLEIYTSNNATCMPIEMDEHGIKPDEIRKNNGTVAHISPTHHFPTGICMPANRRYEMLAWANESESHYIIEDDYDSEFRIKGKPIPTLYSLDVFGKVIYMNTFSKSLASTIRISYMILPEKIAQLFYEKLGFYSCTVSTFEQYALATFISEGYFEKHINRMRLHYGRKRAVIIELIRNQFPESKCQIIENDSGLHFILKLNTSYSDMQIQDFLKKKGIRISSINDFAMNSKLFCEKQFILNYSNIDIQKLKDALKELKQIICHPQL